MDNQAQQTQTGIFFITKFLMPRRNEVNNLRSEMKQKLIDNKITLTDKVRYYTGNTAIPAEAITNDKITIYYGIVNDKKELVRIVTLKKVELKKLLKNKVDNGHKGDRLNPPTDIKKELANEIIWPKGEE